MRNQAMCLVELVKACIHDVETMEMVMSDVVDADALDIPPAYHRVADEYGIPAQVLYSVALTESGMPLVGSRNLRPWPWTLSVAGRTYRYGSRDTAYAGLMQHLALTDLVDIGLMQVNWRYHGSRLVDHELSLDPWFNLRVGASILREMYDQCGDWIVAAGRKFSPDDEGWATEYADIVREQMAMLERESARIH